MVEQVGNTVYTSRNRSEVVFFVRSGSQRHRRVLAIPRVRLEIPSRLHPDGESCRLVVVLSTWRVKLP